MTRTTPYSIVYGVVLIYGLWSNWIVETKHRKVNGVFMCNSIIPWLDLLPIILLSLRISKKTWRRIVFSWFTLRYCDQSLDFHRKIHERPTSIAHHTKSWVFLLPLHRCNLETSLNQKPKFFKSTACRNLFIYVKKLKPKKIFKWSRRKQHQKSSMGLMRRKHETSYSNLPTKMYVTLMYKRWNGWRNVS